MCLSDASPFSTAAASFVEAFHALEFDTAIDFDATVRLLEGYLLEALRLEKATLIAPLPLASDCAPIASPGILILQH